MPRKNLFWRSLLWLIIGMFIEGIFSVILDFELYGIITYLFVLYKIYRKINKDGYKFEFLKPKSPLINKTKDILIYHGLDLLLGSLSMIIIYFLIDKLALDGYKKFLEGVLDIFGTTDFPNFFHFLLGLIGIGILAPIAEEIMFRGFLVDKYSHLNKTKAMLLNALFFGIMHGGFLPQHFIGGIVLYKIRDKQEDIYGAIGLHMLNNMTVVLSFYLPVLLDWFSYGLIGLYVLHLSTKGPILFKNKLYYES